MRDRIARPGEDGWRGAAGELALIGALDDRQMRERVRERARECGSLVCAYHELSG
jgi:hypothetical protein